MPIALVVSAVPLRDLLQQSMAVHVCRMPEGSRAKAGGGCEGFNWICHPECRMTNHHSLLTNIFAWLDRYPGKLSAGIPCSNCFDTASGRSDHSLTILDKNQGFSTAAALASGLTQP